MPVLTLVDVVHYEKHVVEEVLSATHVKKSVISSNFWEKLRILFRWFLESESYLGFPSALCPAKVA